MNNTETLTAKIATGTTTELVDSLIIMEAMRDQADDAAKLAHALVIDELLARFPAVAADIEAWELDLTDTDTTLAEVVLAMLPTVAA